MAITATIITLNEADNIADCISSCRQVCDEIIVVDSGSTDGTQDIAKSLGAEVVEQAYLGDGLQKAFGVQFAHNDWILSLDADERLSEELVNAINKLDLQQEQADCIRFNRRSFVGDVWIRVWYPDFLIRLYNKQSAGFEPIKGHAKVIGRQTKTIGGYIIHYSYVDYAEVVQRTHRFARRGAVILFENNKRAGLFAPFVHGIGALFKVLIAKKGLLHGVHGWHIAVVSAFSSYMKYVILREMWKNKEKQSKHSFR